ADLAHPGRLRRERGPGACRADGCGERLDVVRAVVALAVDEERRRPGDAAQVRAVDVLRDPPGVDAPPHLVAEPVAVEAELARIPDEIGNPERVLAVEQ